MLALLVVPIGFVGLMMLVASLGRTEEAASGAGWALMMPMSMLGGGMIPLAVMPPWIQPFSYASPVRWAIIAYEGAIWRGFSLAEMVTALCHPHRDRRRRLRGRRPPLPGHARMTTTHPTSSTDSGLDLSRIRAAFPALARVHGGHPVAYFDGPGGTQVPEVVVEAMADYLRHHNANTHWRYPTSQETDAALAAARATVADLLHCGADEVSFGANMTTITFHLGRALARQWGPGDEIVDHRARPPRQPGHVARRRGRSRADRSRRCASTPTGSSWTGIDFARQVTPQTKLVAIGAASNALGTINDVAARRGAGQGGRAR